MIRGLTAERRSMTIEPMYRRPKFLEVLLDIRQEMAREADYDVDLFAEMVRSGNGNGVSKGHRMTEPDADDVISTSKKATRRKQRPVSVK